MNLLSLSSRVFEVLKEMECITETNSSIVLEIIERKLNGTIGSNEAEEMLSGELSKWYSFEWLFVRDIFNLCNAFSNQPIPNLDLGLNWIVFTGSNLKTTRPLCIAMKKRKYFHIYEIPEIIKGIIDGRQLPLADNGFPEGMFPCTTIDNYLHLLNGRSCGHGFSFTMSYVVPDALKQKVYRRLRKLYPNLEIPL